MANRVTIRDIMALKPKGEKVPMVTAYDYTTARQADEAQIPMVLVGDSLGMVVLGYDSTIPVTMEDMLHHVKAVSRGARNALIVADLPFMSYQIDASQALGNAARLIQEGGAHAVKLEGGIPVAATVKRIVECGIPVMGHLGLTPQSIHKLGGYRAQGRVQEDAYQIVRSAEALQEAGAFAIVLELIPAPLAGLVSHRISIPTIGIGAGALCDGQVQVAHDMLGLYTDFLPRHAKRYAYLGDEMCDAFRTFGREVREGIFPTQRETVGMDESELEELEASLAS